MPRIIQPLTRFHDGQPFGCGDQDLNAYLRYTARQHSEKGIARTFVAVDDTNSPEILGFFTLVSCEIFVEKLSRKFAKKYPSRAPAVKLARLAVASHLQRKGLGAYLLLDAMDRVLRVAEHLGIIGFFVDAKHEEAANFYRRFGFLPLPDNALELFLPVATIREAIENK
jgi:GNAT superfamily N-acetyltransferase